MRDRVSLGDGNGEEREIGGKTGRTGEVDGLIVPGTRGDVCAVFSWGEGE